MVRRIRASHKRIDRSRQRFWSIRRAHTAVIAVLTVVACGCEGLQEAGVPGMEAFVDKTEARLEEQRYRERFLEDKEPEALKWLLENRIHSGMSVVEVNQVLGEAGEREFNDRWVKTDGDGRYRSSDRVYRWGPDNQGRSIYLVFRDNQLVNFDSKDYAEALLNDI